MSFRTKKPVRVFRSSNLKFSPYRPAAFEGARTSYRYDGLYVVTHVWDSEGYKTDGDIPVGGCQGGVQFTFHLERLPQPQNLISTEDLFLKIQQSHCCGPHLPFTPPQPKNGDDILPALIQNMDELLATASSSQQQSRQPSFQQPLLMINQGAVIELEKFLGFISKKQFERQSKVVRKKEERTGLPIGIVDAVFGCILECKSPPQIDFKIILTEGTKLSPPPFDYEGKTSQLTLRMIYPSFFSQSFRLDGIYALVHIDFPIPQALYDRVVREETLELMNGRWTIGGSHTLSSTNFPNFRKRSMCPKGICSGKRGALYTLVTSTGRDWCDCRLVHVYHSSKLKEVEKAPVQEKQCTPVSSSPEVETPTPIMFTVKETVYAYDKGKSGDVLYEAQVIKFKEDAGSLKYFVQYKGYKKSHNKWLSTNEIMKQTKQNHAKYLKSRSQSSLTSKPSAKTTKTSSNRRRERAREDAKAQLSPVKSSKTKKRRRSGSDSGASERVESKRKW